MPQLKAVLDVKLAEYNEANAMMDLVLFEQASIRVALYFWGKTTTFH